MQRLVGECLLKRSGSRGSVTGLAEHMGQREEQGDIPLSERLTSHRCPSLEPILGQQLALVEPDCRAQVVSARRALSVRRHGRGLEFLDIDLEPVRAEAHHVVGKSDPRGAVIPARVQRPAGHEHGLAQVIRRRGPVAIGPQGLRDVLTMQRVLRGQSQQLDQRPGLAQPPGRVLHGDTIDGDTKAAEELDPQYRSQLP